MPDFLLELLSEEIPARMQARAREDLARMFADAIGKAGLGAHAIETFATPRRLALIARGLSAATEPVREETKGPRASAPPQALDGFLRKTGLAREDLVERDGVLFAIVERPGRATADVLAEAIPAIVRAFPWPKSMRWGAGDLRWVRPLQGIVALLGEEVVPFAVDGIASGAATVGHRFHHPGLITIGSAADYADKLRMCRVIVDPDERAGIIRDRAASAAADAGLTLISDEGLVAENAGLTEWPVPLLGRFDPAFLDVPREVIQLTMRTNQKYFACTGSDGALAPAFVCTANIEAADGGAAIVAGNAKVLSARLSDARFFWEQDLKIPLEEQAKKLTGIVFHEKLGTVADKVERVAKLARWLVEEGIISASSSPLAGRGTAGEAGGGGGSILGDPLAGSPLHHASHGPPPRSGEELADLAHRAALLCKADLVTGMVGEFPELQGVIGGHLAAAQDEDPRIAAAIRDHYKPIGQGDEVPTDPVTVAVSLADKLDTIVAFFAIDEKPTGSRDPFALRRAAIGVTQLILSNGLREPCINLAGVAGSSIARQMARGLEEEQGRSLLSHRFSAALYLGFFEFLVDRLKVQQREAGVRHDLIDAVFALGGEDDLVRLLARVRALQAFVATEDGANLLAGYKRAANIVGIEAKKDAASGEKGLTNLNQSGYTPLREEAALVAALDAAEPAASAAVEREDFAGAMRALASLRAPIDAFFDKVTVNDPDPAKRSARLALLARIRDAVHRVADFSRIEG